jgi:hypothetical protein
MFTFTYRNSDFPSFFRIISLALFFADAYEELRKVNFMIVALTLESVTHIV